MALVKAINSLKRDYIIMHSGDNTGFMEFTRILSILQEADRMYSFK